MPDWVINAGRFRLMLVLGALFAIAIGVLGFAIVGNAQATCAAQNRSLDALRDVVVAQADGPHRFNTPIDLHNRAVILRDELAKIDAARCRT